MRVLFVANPRKSIFQYLVTLAWAMRTAGHEVHFASQPAFAQVVTRAGLTAVPVGRDQDTWRLTEWRPDVGAALRTGVIAPYDVAVQPEKADWAYLRDGYVEHVRWWHRMDNLPIISDLVAYARAWRPDLVVWEPLTYAAPIAAKACGAAHARLLFGLDVFGVTRQHFVRLRDAQPAAERVDPLADWLASYGDRYGFSFSEDMTVGDFTVDQFPRSLQIEASLPSVRVGYVPYGGPATVPDWLRTPPERPRVALTLGLSATEHFRAYAVDVREVLEHLGSLDVELVATIADEERAKLGPLPANVRVMPYVPLLALAPTCAAVVHHAGAATMATVSRHGVPQLALPLHYDQPALADRLAHHGAGLAIHSDEATGPAVRDAVFRLMHEPAFARRAGDLSREIAELPSPNEAVERIMELAGEHRDR